MESSVLLVEFITGTKKKTFILSVSSYQLTESGGIHWQNTFNLVLDKEFFDFWKYLKNYIGDNYGVDFITTQKRIDFSELKPIKAVITQKNRGIDSNLPWINTLEVSDNNTSENIVFYPFSCESVT